MEFFELETFIKTIGLLGVIGVIFAETGLLIGFFLPGDSLLFTAGFLASRDFLNFPGLLIGSFIAAVVGDSVGYAFGKRVGPAIFRKEESFFFSKENINRARVFYERHGGQTIILARFMPVVRTFAPILAGVGRMSYTHFLAYNIVGGLFWTVGLTTLGYFLGSILPDPDKYILPIIGLIIILSILPAVIHALRDRTVRQKIRSFFHK